MRSASSWPPATKTTPTGIADSKSPNCVNVESAIKLKLTQLDLTAETATKNGSNARSTLIEDKNATESNKCTTKIGALEQLVEKFLLEVGKASTERKT